MISQNRVRLQALYATIYDGTITEGRPSGGGGMTMRHELKAWPLYFQAVVDGRKTFDIRKEDDRKFAVGDELLLREFEPPTPQTTDAPDPDLGRYTGRSALVRVLYLMRGPAFGLPDGHVVMAIEADPIELSGAVERMRLYRILYESEDSYVEAESMPAAIAAWKAHIALVCGDGTEEPEACGLVHDEPVVRSLVYVNVTNQQPQATPGTRRTSMSESIDSGIPFRDVVARSLHLQGKADSDNDTRNLQVDEGSEFLSIVLDVLAHEFPHSQVMRELEIRKATRPQRPMPKSYDAK